MLNKRNNHNFFFSRKDKGERESKSKNVCTHANFIWMKEGRDKSSMTKNNCRVCWIPLVRSRMLDSLFGCLRELCASDFHWIFFSFWLSLIFSFAINFPRFFKRHFRPMKIFLLRYSQNNYQIWLYKLKLMCEELSYQIISISAANQAISRSFQKSL